MNFERVSKVVLTEIMGMDGVDTLAPRLLKFGDETKLGSLLAWFDRAGVKEYPFGIDRDGFIVHRWCRVLVEPPEDMLGEVTLGECRRPRN